MNKERDCENCIHYSWNEEIKHRMCESWSCNMKTLEEALEDAISTTKEENNA